jgi:hypothetical protein
METLSPFRNNLSNEKQSICSLHFDVAITWQTFGRRLWGGGGVGGVPSAKIELEFDPTTSSNLLI